MKVLEDDEDGEAGKAAVKKAITKNGLTIADLSAQTGVPLAELETFLTPAKITMTDDAASLYAKLGPDVIDSNRKYGVAALDTGPSVTGGSEAADMRYSGVGGSEAADTRNSGVGKSKAENTKKTRKRKSKKG